MLSETPHIGAFFHCQDLSAQVSAETDPITLLPKVVSLLYIQVLV